MATRTCFGERSLCRNDLAFCLELRARLARLVLVETGDDVAAPCMCWPFRTTRTRCCCSNAVLSALRIRPRAAWRDHRPGDRCHSSPAAEAVIITLTELAA